MRTIQALTGMIATCALLAALIVVNLLQMLSFALVKPFSPTTFRRLNRYFADKWWGGCVVVSERIIGARLTFTGDRLPARENAIVVCNHQSAVDILMLLCLGFRKERLGDLKWFVKDVLKYVPGVGWGMLFLDCLFVKREWAADRGSIEQTFSRLVGQQSPVWLISFLEGTRQTPAKLRKSQEFAGERGMKPLENVMIPRTKGFVATARGLGGHAGFVYDVTIGYEGDAPPTLGEFVRGRRRSVHLHLRRFAIADLPVGDAELAEWTMELFRQKDELLGQFKRDGRFPGKELSEPLTIVRWLTAGLAAG